MSLLLAAKHLHGAEPVVQDWIRKNAIPLGTRSIEVGEARIVAIGEATHGTREFQQWKHRMFEWLVTRKGFSIVALEANMAEAKRLDDFVLTGEGDPAKLLRGLVNPLLHTQELLDLILWMRAYNQSGKGPVHFAGFDMQDPRAAMVAVQRFVEKHSLAIKVNERPVRGDWERVVEQLASLPPRDGLAWAVQCARLVVQLAEFGEQMGSPKGSMETREECMARNVQWILSESKGAKAMLWAHNFHVMTAPDPMGVRTMGMRLRSLYAQQMVTIGFAFGRGSFQAYSMERRLREFTRDEAPAESLDAELAAIGIPAYALDLRAAPSSGPVAEWLAKAHTTRNVMASYVEGRPEYITFEQELKGRYDCLVFVAETTAVRGLP